MFHSLPAAAIFGEIAYLLASGDDMLRLYKAGAVVLGYMSHLILDEIWSIEWSHGLHFKSSFGTALKLFGHNWGANLSTYAKLSVLTMLIFFQPAWMQQYFQQTANSAAVSSASASPAPKSAAHRIVWPWQ